MYALFLAEVTVERQGHWPLWASPFSGFHFSFFCMLCGVVRLFSLSRGVSLHPVMPARIMVAVATCLACASSNKVFMEMTKPGRPSDRG